LAVRGARAATGDAGVIGFLSNRSPDESADVVEHSAAAWAKPDSSKDRTA